MAYFTGSLIVAGLVGGVTQSWPVFAVALAVMLASNVWLNEIRLKQPRRGHGHKRSPNHGEES